MSGTDPVSGVTGMALGLSDGPVGSDVGGLPVPVPPSAAVQKLYRAGVPDVPTTTEGLSDEQKAMVEAVVEHLRDAIVDATVGSGKALTDSSRVPTPLGWRLVGDIRVGDELYTRRGTPTKVTGVFPQGTRDVYEVTLRDGRVVRCSGDHNWWARKTARRKVLFEVLTTREMLDQGVSRHAGKYDVYRFRIPAHNAVMMPEVEQPIDPYVVGVFLGNGCCTEKYLAVSCPDSSVPEKVAGILGYTVKRRSLNNYSWDFFDKNGNRPHVRDFFKDMVDELCVLSGDKRVPDVYQRGSLSQRKALINGLMDTDGGITRAGGRYTTSFSTTSVRLAQDFRDVMGSLGWVVSEHKDRRGIEKYRTGVCYDLKVLVSNDDKPDIFSVGDKYDLAVEASRHVKKRGYNYDEVSISSIRKLDYRESMTCFQVEDGEHLFLADNYVVTHNTTAIQRLCSIAGSAPGGLGWRVLYLTYSKLLKADAQARVVGAKVQNFHGIVYPALLRAGLRCSIGESIAVFNRHFDQLKQYMDVYDLLVIDEYQDLSEEYAELLVNIKSLNPTMRVVMVGDLEQKVKATTRLDAQAFARDFCDNPVMCSFTQSFRMGPEMGDLLGTAWNKPVVGVNDDQTVEMMSYKKIEQVLAEAAPGDVLCLGARKGALASMLNTLETKYADKYNKNTVYASIKDTDEKPTYDDKTAVFTTFDSAKGMERDLCVVFGYNINYWELRTGMPNADTTVLRNVFLVAASRGKKRIIFAERADDDEMIDDWADMRGLDVDDVLDDGVIGGIPVGAFAEVVDEWPEYTRPLSPSGMFSFKYAENVEEAYDAVTVTEQVGVPGDVGDSDGSGTGRADDGVGVIEANRIDGLIDLSPAVGTFVELLFFDNYDVATEFASYCGPYGLPDWMSRDLADRLTKINREEADGKMEHGAAAWRRALVLAAADTEQMRYVTQTSVMPGGEMVDKVMTRLGSRLRPDAPSQVPALGTGVFVSHDEESGAVEHRTPVAVEGLSDTVIRRSDGTSTVVELKFVSELSHEMVLQVALYVVLGGYTDGLLWNLRTGQCLTVSVPDTDVFLDRVAVAVSKQRYDSWMSV